ncbi:hypothetical protein [Phenylobacterium sp.]|jgi:hypothetical protein|uniref:hypothetical protein n=1 Tax=Phenylobacterium sp. TaxID=1871053 RepID=UPI002F943DD3
MNAPNDVIPVPASPAIPPIAPPAAEDRVPPSLFQEINARRAQVENPELLRRLRGL